MGASASSSLDHSAPICLGGRLNEIGEHVFALVCVSPTFSTVCFPSLYVLCVSRLAEGSVSDVPMCVAWGGQGVSGLSHPNNALQEGKKICLAWSWNPS